MEPVFLIASVSKLDPMNAGSRHASFLEQEVNITLQSQGW